VKIIFVILVLIFHNSCVNYTVEERFNQQIGKYKLDIVKSSKEIIDSNYNKIDSLVIMFCPDSTFRTNKVVSFFPDTFGLWKINPIKFENWNNLYFGVHKGSNMKPSLSCQFGNFSNDSTIAIVMQSKGGLEGVNYIYIKKIE
jgi:hypothetical protein